MGSNGEFPAGLRVLVVDHDSTSNLERLLQKFKYEVRTCNCGRAAMDMLGEKNEKFNFEIVISDVNMKDVDGFEFLQHVALKLEVPVIMMSGDGETSQVMRGIGSGACAYLPKPIKPRDAQFIWQHVHRKRMARGDENSPSPTSEIDLTAGKNQRELAEGDSSGSIKKPRVIWTPELHQRFENAVEQIRRNNNKVGPKRILELMGDTSLTREQIASHLQKCRSKSEREDTNSYPQQPSSPPMMIDAPIIHQDIAIEAQIQPPNGYHPFHLLFVDPYTIQQALNTNANIPRINL